jgi:hypothetical protein
MSTTKFPLAVLHYLSLFVLAVSVVASPFVFGWNGVSSTNDVAVDESSPHTSEQRTRVMESEVITATRRGFEPAAITRPQGKFILMIDNGSGTDLTFRFSRETGESIHNITSSREQLDWNEVVDLEPGEYVLTERDHPDWTCLIRITAR